MQLSSESPEESDVTYPPDTAGPSEKVAALLFLGQWQRPF